MMKPFAAFIVSIVAILGPRLAFPADQPTEDNLPNRLQGDVGGAIYSTSSPIRGGSSSPKMLPYTYFDYGRFFARIDTFGVKTLPFANGYLEIAGRIKFDGYKTSTLTMRGINERKNSVPIGIGTFQLTLIGGFFLNAFHDINLSNGNMYEIIYVARMNLGKAVIYPQAGIEYFSDRYNRYYYGISNVEAAASGYPAYMPGASTIPSLGAMLEIPIQGNWYSNLYLRRRWLGPAIGNSPLVDTGHQDTRFITFNYRYK